MQTLPSLAQERTEVTRALDQATVGHDYRAVLDTEHAASVLTFNIEKLKHESAELRSRIREMLFTGVKQPDGSLKYYLKTEVPTGALTDGRIWRIRAGNTPLKEDQVPLKGGGSVVGEIPKGLPSFSLPHIDFQVMGTLFSYAAIISLLGFMEAISIAKAMAGKTGQRLDPNQELIGQGLANILGAIGKSYPTSGSFSRSAVNLQAGAVTGLSSVFTGITVVSHVILFHSAALLFAPIGPGRGNHDGGYRSFKRIRVYSCLSGPVVRRGDFHYFLCRHPDLCSPPGQGNPDRGGVVLVGFPL